MANRIMTNLFVIENENGDPIAVVGRNGITTANGYTARPAKPFEELTLPGGTENDDHLRL